jgi:hypothetical protein
VPAGAPRLDHLDGPLQRVVGDLGQQAHALRLGGVDASPGEDERQGLRAQDAGQQVGRAVGDREADAVLREVEGRLGAADPRVAGQRQLRRAADGEPVERRHHRELGVEHGPRHLLEARDHGIEARPVQVGGGVEVVTRGEGPAAAREYQPRRTFGEVAHRRGDGGEHRRREGVELGRAVEAQDRHVARPGRHEMLAGGLPVEVDHRPMVVGRS